MSVGAAAEFNRLKHSARAAREQRAPLESFLSDDETLNGIPGGITSPGYGTRERRRARGLRGATESNVFLSSEQCSSSSALSLFLPVRPSLRMSREFKTNVSGKDVIRQDVINVEPPSGNMRVPRAKPVKSPNNFDRAMCHARGRPLKRIASSRPHFVYVRSYRGLLSRTFSPGSFRLLPKSVRIVALEP